MTWRDRERESVSVSDADNVLVMQLCNRDRESVSTDQGEQKITAFNLLMMWCEHEHECDCALCW